MPGIGWHLCVGYMEELGPVSCRVSDSMAVVVVEVRGPSSTSKLGQEMHLQNQTRVAFGWERTDAAVVYVSVHPECRES